MTKRHCHRPSCKFLPPWQHYNLPPKYGERLWYMGWDNVYCPDTSAVALVPKFRPTEPVPKCLEPKLSWFRSVWFPTGHLLSWHVCELFCYRITYLLTVYIPQYSTIYDVNESHKTQDSNFFLIPGNRFLEFSNTCHYMPVVIDRIQARTLRRNKRLRRWPGRVNVVSTVCLHV